MINSTTADSVFGLPRDGCHKCFVRWIEGTNVECIADIKKHHLGSVRFRDKKIKLCDNCSSFIFEAAN